MQVYELLGPFLFSHVLADFCDQILSIHGICPPCGIRMTAVVETWPAVLEFLHQVKSLVNLLA